MWVQKVLNFIHKISQKQKQKLTLKRKTNLTIFSRDLFFQSTCENEFSFSFLETRPMNFPSDIFGTECGTNASIVLL
jgi:hypothetical protein